MKDLKIERKKPQTATSTNKQYQHNFEELKSPDLSAIENSVQNAH